MESRNVDGSYYSLAGRKILVTGGAGFIGSHTVDLLVDAGCSEIVVIDDMIRGRPGNLAAALKRGPVRIVEGDICSRDLMRDLIQGVDTVFHLAALRITQCAAEPARAMDVMVAATFDLLKLCVEMNVRKVVMASSASIYGMAETFPTSESHHPYDNRTLYGAAKLFGEGLLRCFKESDGLDYVALRYFNVYGPRMDIHGRYTEVLARWMERIQSGLPPIIFGTGSQTMDLVHVTDVARANILAARSPVTDVALNVGSRSETSLMQLAQLLCQVMGRGDMEPLREKERAVNPVPRRLADTAAADQLIGFKASVSLADGMRDLVAWWRMQNLVPASAEMGRQ
jgi:UDP-glucose 4-epimerase